MSAVCLPQTGSLIKKRSERLILDAAPVYDVIGVFGLIESNNRMAKSGSMRYRKPFE